MKGKWAIAIGLVLSMVLIPSALAGASQTIVVEPTGADDTANIQAACDSVGLGGVVELTAGHFSLSRPIVVRNWSGTVRGQGKDKTILHTSADEFPRVPLGTPLGDWSVAGMLMFMYDDGAVGELHVQGLGFRPTGLSTPDPDYGDLDIQPILVATWKDGAVAHVDSTWRDLRIQGDRSSGHPEGINVKYGLGLLQVPGTHVISDVDFDTSFGVGIVANFLSSGKLIVGGPHAGDRVTFTDMGFGGVYGFTDSNMEIDVSNVQARNVGTAFAMYELDNCRVHMWDVETVNGSGAATGPCAVGCAARLSTYLFEHNVIRQQPESLWAGFEIWQDWDVKSNIVIRNNKISGQGSYL